jgi:hypothetical protein
MYRHGKRNRRRIILLLLCAGLLGPRAYGQAIIAPAGRTVFNGESLIRSFTEIENLSVRTPGGQVTEVTQYVAPLALVYGFHPNWEVIAVQPYVVADVTIRTATGTVSSSLNGLADSQFFVQYDGFYNHNAPGGLTRLSGVFGVEAPTGARRFSPQAFQYTAGAIFEKVAKLRYAFTADFEYTIATKNDQGLSVGNRAQFDAVPAYFLIPRDVPGADASWSRKAFHRVFRNGAYLILEFNGTWQGQAQQNGVSVPSTGGTTLSISPGIQFFASRRFLAEFSAPIPAVKSLNGVQPRPDSAFLIGFRWLF